MNRVPAAWFLFAMLLTCVFVSEGRGVPRDVQRREVYEPEYEPLLDPGPNLFLKAAVTASSHDDDETPEQAVNGNHVNVDDRWACKDASPWMQIDLKEKKKLNLIRLWLHWADPHVYQYLIEGSADKKSWTILVDRRKNSERASKAGREFSFPTAEVRYVKISFFQDAAKDFARGYLVDIEGYGASPAVAKRMMSLDEAWQKVPDGLSGALGSVDVRYNRDEVPTIGSPSNTWKAAAWRGERVHTQLALWTRTGAGQVRCCWTPLRSAQGGEIAASCLRAAFVRYVLGDGQLLADVLDDAERLDVALKSVRPIWVSVDVPPDAKPGLYTGQLTVKAEGGISLPFEIRLEVLPAVLPPPAQWAFWLDLWQNPFAVARYHHVKPWSAEHLALMEPLYKMLADAGQKCITTTIVYQPWGGERYDPYDTMVQWLRRADGHFSYDYTVFDKYVELAMRCGITGAINCYSVVPCSNTFRYFDEPSGQYVSEVSREHSPPREEIWTPFLKDFSRHVKEKGWLEKTAIAMDERPPEMMRPAIKLLHKVAPELKIALAGNYSAELKDAIHDWCIFIESKADPGVVRDRVRRGMPTTFYVCCGPPRPNNFPYSPPAESTWMGWYSAAQGFSGFLRWAYDVWTEDPLYDTTWVRWPAGDCFLVYPGPRSSIRFERLREGIQDYEKLRIVRAGLEKREDPQAKKCMKGLDEALAAFTFEKVKETPAAWTVEKGKKALLEASRLMGD